MKHPPRVAGCSTEVELVGPLDVPASVEMFRRSGDDLIDRWDGEVLLRTVRLAGEAVAVAVRPLGDVAHPRVQVTVSDPHHLDGAARAVSGFFATVPPAVLAEVGDRDPVARAAEALNPGVRPVLQRDPLTALVRSISAQQINLRFAATVRARLAQRYGRRHDVEGREVYSLEPSALAEARAADLRALQFTTRKAEYIVGVAAAVLGGSLDIAHLESQDDEGVVTTLVALPGIGRWSAEWLLARSLGRPVVVAGDLGVRKAVGRAYRDGTMPSEAEVREITAHWGAAAGVVQQSLLHVLAQDRWAELRALSGGAAAP